MPRIPAVCDKCGKVSLSGVFIMDSTYHIKEYVEGPCQCGGDIRILDGTYTHLGGPINLCNTSEEAIARFREFCAECGV